MSKKINEKFLEAYLVLDSDLSKKFGLKTGGATEYINRLSSAKSAEGRDIALPRLVKYRSVRNRLAHEPGAMKSLSEVSSADIKWIRRFTKFVRSGKDPLALHNKSKNGKSGGLGRAILIFVLLAAVVAGVVFAIKYLGII